jgi:hypothetical protein
VSLRREIWLEVRDDKWVPVVGEGDRGEDIGSGFWFFLGRGPLLLILFVLPFSLFCFSDLFITFAFWIQIDSN